MRPWTSLADKYPRLKRASVLVLVAAGAAAYFIVRPYIPHDHDVVLQLEDPSTLTALDLTWSYAQGSDDTISSSRRNFAQGSAPKLLHANVGCPHGDYWLEATLIRGAQACTSRQRVQLIHDSIKVRLSCDDNPPP